ncbi:hypothetical protein P280DRAFT_120393 [Massarina eburnea CBS 473.64]|uniref:Uncharacterized protein n=1 Tax=Massarina eburnea CBS 473.64 TaxID=1395130 RepID=A0A6A6SCF2_9PLEO|nr:hypothetical protein P280DRAFT_120393 [Massarina eburnea CBS 473.64]
MDNPMPGMSPKKLENIISRLVEASARRNQAVVNSPRVPPPRFPAPALVPAPASSSNSTFCLPPPALAVPAPSANFSDAGTEMRLIDLSNPNSPCLDVAGLSDVGHREPSVGDKHSHTPLIDLSSSYSPCLDVAGPSDIGHREPSVGDKHPHTPLIDLSSSDSPCLDVAGLSDVGHREPSVDDKHPHTPEIEPSGKNLGQEPSPATTLSSIPWQSLQRWSELLFGNGHTHCQSDEDKALAAFDKQLEEACQEEFAQLAAEKSKRVIVTNISPTANEEEVASALNCHAWRFNKLNKAKGIRWRIESIAMLNERGPRDVQTAHVNMNSRDAAVFVVGAGRLAIFGIEIGLELATPVADPSEK